MKRLRLFHPGIWEMHAGLGSPAWCSGQAVHVLSHCHSTDAHDTEAATRPPLRAAHQIQGALVLALGAKGPL